MVRPQPAPALDHVCPREPLAPACSREDIRHLPVPQDGCRRRRNCVDEAESLSDLRTRYLALLLQAAERDIWHEVWQLFLCHPWFRQKLELSARLALRSVGLSPQWLEDVQQEVALRLADKLRRVPHLHLDYERAEQQFGGWLFTILLRDCRHAIRKLRRLHYRSASLYDHCCVADSTPMLDARLDYQDALQRLDDAESTIVLLYGQGYAVREIAEALGFTGSKTYRVLNRAMTRLQRQLSSERDRTVQKVKRSPR